MLTKCIKYFFFLRKGYSIRKRDGLLSCLEGKKKKAKQCHCFLCSSSSIIKKKQNDVITKENFRTLLLRLLRGHIKFLFLLIKESFVRLTPNNSILLNQQYLIVFFFYSKYSRSYPLFEFTEFIE